MLRTPLCIWWFRSKTHGLWWVGMVVVFSLPMVGLSFMQHGYQSNLATNTIILLVWFWFMAESVIACIAVTRHNIIWVVKKTLTTPLTKLMPSHLMKSYVYIKKLIGLNRNPFMFVTSSVWRGSSPTFWHMGYLQIKVPNFSCNDATCIQKTQHSN